MIPKKNGVKQGVMIPDNIRHQSLQTTPEIFVGLIVVQGLALDSASIFFGFWYLFMIMNDAEFVDKSQVTDMPIGALGGNTRHDVTVVDDTVYLSRILVPEITVADSGRTDGVNPGGIGIAVGRQGGQGGAQAVSAEPDFDPLAVQPCEVNG